MELSRVIPARRKTVKFKWVYKFFMQATDEYLKIRDGLHKSRRGTMTFCDWCKKPFEKDEWFALAQPKIKQDGPKRNWTLCHGCADLMGAPCRKENPENWN